MEKASTKVVHREMRMYSKPLRLTHVVYNCQLFSWLCGHTYCLSKYQHADVCKYKVCHEKIVIYLLPAAESTAQHIQLLSVVPGDLKREWQKTDIDKGERES